MTGQLYDDIGEAFEGFKGLPLARYVEVPGFLALVGEVRGRSVLDLACGTGFYSREFKRRGASDVLGVDISGVMVAAARAREDEEPLGSATRRATSPNRPPTASASTWPSPSRRSTTPTTSPPSSGCAGASTAA